MVKVGLVSQMALIASLALSGCHVHLLDQQPREVTQSREEWEKQVRDLLNEYDERLKVLEDCTKAEGEDI